MTQHEQVSYFRLSCYNDMNAGIKELHVPIVYLLYKQPMPEGLSNLDAVVCCFRHSVILEATITV